MPVIILRNRSQNTHTNEVKIGDAFDSCDPDLRSLGQFTLGPGETQRVATVTETTDVYYKNILQLYWSHHVSYRNEEETEIDIDTSESSDSPVDICDLQSREVSNKAVPVSERTIQLIGKPISSDPLTLDLNPCGGSPKIVQVPTKSIAGPPTRIAKPIISDDGTAHELMSLKVLEGEPLHLQSEVTVESLFAGDAIGGQPREERREGRLVADYTVPRGGRSTRHDWGDVRIEFSTNRAEGTDFYLHVEKNCGNSRCRVFQGQAHIFADGRSGPGPYQLADSRIRKIHVTNGNHGEVRIRVFELFGQ